MEQNASSVFLRKSSGLVKAAGFWDVFIYNAGLISIGIGVAYTQKFGPAYYPNASITTATILAALLMVFVVLGFWAWSTAIPRSGGIYVFLTRSQSPAFGFALSFVECISWLFYVAIASTLMVTVGIVPLIALLIGPNAQSIEIVSSSVGQLTIGSIIIWLAVLLLSSGTKKYLLYQRIIFVFAVIGTVALLITISSENALSIFQVNFNNLFSKFGSNPYQDVIAAAKNLGWKETTTYFLSNSISLLVWPFLPLIGSAFSIALGGEIRKSSKNQMLGMMGALIFSTIIFVLIAIFGESAIGTNFQGAIGFNFDNAVPGEPAMSTPFAPYFPYLAGLATNSTVLRLLICLGFISWVWFWIPGVLAYTERAFLAWALDRAAPSCLAKLHPKFSTPYIAIITGGIIAQTFLFLILYTNFFATLVFILAAAIAWFITLIFGVVFPYSSPELFNFTPMANKKLFGLPVMSVVCLFGAIALAIVVYLLWNDPIAAGHSPKSIAVVSITFIIGFLFHLVLRKIRKRQGIDISLAYKEIPVE